MAERGEGRFGLRGDVACIGAGEGEHGRVEVWLGNVAVLRWVWMA